jgi:hypothetical protein
MQGATVLLCVPIRTNCIVLMPAGGPRFQSLGLWASWGKRLQGTLAAVGSLHRLALPPGAAWTKRWEAWTKRCQGLDLSGVGAAEANVAAAAGLPSSERQQRQRGAHALGAARGRLRDAGVVQEVQAGCSQRARARRQGRRRRAHGSGPRALSLRSSAARKDQPGDR